jgi:DNA mismatch repair protein MutS2
MQPSYPEVDLHGLFADEAVERLERAIADALEGGYDRLRVIHGKGSGALRREVREALRRHPMVRTYQYASPHDGGEGATIAALGTKY